VKMLLTSLLQTRKVQAPDGLMRGDVVMPRNAQIIHLGIVSPNGQIGLSYVTDPPPIDKETGKQKFTDLVSLEFVVVAPGQSIPAGYDYRAAVREYQGAVVYLFQKVDDKPSLLVVGGQRGQG